MIHQNLYSRTRKKSKPTLRSPAGGGRQTSSPLQAAQSILVFTMPIADIKIGVLAMQVGHAPPCPRSLPSGLIATSCPH